MAFAAAHAHAFEIKLVAQCKIDGALAGNSQPHCTPLVVKFMCKKARSVLKNFALVDFFVRGFMPILNQEVLDQFTGPAGEYELAEP